MPRSPKISAALKKRAARIKVILMDVDGTMTDGGVTLLSQPDGSALEIKTFDAHDGQGLTLAHTAGLRTGCITGRESAALLRRAHEMKMEFIYMKIALKIPAYEEILAKAGVSDAEVAFIGDDLPDIPLLRRVGLAVAVGDAVADVKKVAHYTTQARAGSGRGPRSHRSDPEIPGQLGTADRKSASLKKSLRLLAGHAPLGQISPVQFPVPTKCLDNRAAGRGSFARHRG